MGIENSESLEDAARIIGCTPEALLAAIERNGTFDPHGERYEHGGAWRVPKWELSGSRLSMHQRRLAGGSSGIPK